MPKIDKKLIGIVNNLFVFQGFHKSVWFFDRIKKNLSNTENSNKKEKSRDKQ